MDNFFIKKNYSLEERSEAGTPALWFVFWDPTQPMGTRPLAIQKNGTWFVYGHDLTKNVCEVFGSDGYIKTTYSYSPFGNVSSVGNFEQNFQWSSEFYDPELDLVYYNYRHYSPTTARWLSRDPIEERGGLNLYAFCKNCITFFVDEKGMVWPSLIPSGMGVYIPTFSISCCNGKPYDPQTHCCRTINNKEVLTSVNEMETVLFYVELRGRWGIPGLLQHAWIEGDFIPGGSAGFYPRNDSVISLPGEVRFPDPAVKNLLPGWNKPSSARLPYIPLSPISPITSPAFIDSKPSRSVVRRPVKVSACEADGFKLCINFAIITGNDLNYIMLFYRDCEIWATDVIEKCKKKAKR